MGDRSGPGARRPAGGRAGRSPSGGPERSSTARSRPRCCGRAPGAIWLDALAAENRPGRHGVWQRVVERRRVARAPLLMTMAASAEALAPLDGRPHADAVVVPVAIERSDAAGGPRDIDVLAYAGDPVKRRLDLHPRRLAAGAARGGDARGGGDRAARDAMPGVRFVGRLAPPEYRALLRRARVFVTAPRREDFGITALEALADGAMLVTTPVARRLSGAGAGPPAGSAAGVRRPGRGAAARRSIDPRRRLRGAGRRADGAVQPRRGGGDRSANACSRVCCQDGRP